MECKDIRQNLFGIVENTLSPAFMAEVENHLTSCRECSEILSGFRQTTAIIEKDIAMEPDPFSGTRILQQLESAFFPEQLSERRSYFRILQPALLTLSLIVAILIGHSIGKKGINIIPAASSDQEMESVRSDLFISDFTDEDKTLFLNQ